MLIAAARTGLSAPVNLTWEITFACNLRCRHCLSAAGKARPEELSTAECLAMVDELARLKVFQVNIGGGEPFFRPDFLTILDYILARGLVACVSTNGSLLHEETCRRLADMEGLFLQVSVDGVNEETNDFIRAPGAFRQALRAMEALAGHGISFSLNTVLTRLNFDQLEDLKTLAGNYGANLRVSRFRPSGRGQEAWDELAPSRDQLESFAYWLEQDPRIMTGDSFFSLTSENRRRLGLDLCGAAKMTCCLSPTGEFYPCAFLQEPQFASGNIRQTSLKRVWNEAPVFQEFRKLEARSCEWCYRFETCRGGCPAVAYHTFRDLEQPDPECWQCIGGQAPRQATKG